MIALFIISIILDRAARTNVAWSTRGAAFSVEIFFLWKAAYLSANAQQTRETKQNEAMEQNEETEEGGGGCWCRSERSRHSLLSR